MASNGVDGYLVVALDTSDMPETFVPVSATTTTTRVKPPSARGEARRETETSVTREHGGYTMRRSTTRYRMTLNDGRSDATAWIALDDMGSEVSTRLEPFCEEVAVQLTRDGLVKPDDR